MSTCALPTRPGLAERSRTCARLGCGQTFDPAANDEANCHVRSPRSTAQRPDDAPVPSRPAALPRGCVRNVISSTLSLPGRKSYSCCNTINKRALSATCLPCAEPLQRSTRSTNGCAYQAARRARIAPTSSVRKPSTPARPCPLPPRSHSPHLRLHQLPLSPRSRSHLDPRCRAPRKRAHRRSRPRRGTRRRSSRMPRTRSRRLERPASARRAAWRRRMARSGPTPSAASTLARPSSTKARRCAMSSAFALRRDIVPSPR